jgi:hypothetical protein
MLCVCGLLGSTTAQAQDKPATSGIVNMHFEPTIAEVDTDPAGLRQVLERTTRVTVDSRDPVEVVFMVGVVRGGEVLSLTRSAPTEVTARMKRAPWDAFDDPLVGFDDPLVGFDNPIISFDDPLVGFENPIISFDDPLVGLEKAWTRDQPALVLFALPKDAEGRRAADARAYPVIVPFEVREGPAQR